MCFCIVIYDALQLVENAPEGRSVSATIEKICIQHAVEV